jgi:hypothetical protein
MTKRAPLFAALALAAAGCSSPPPKNPMQMQGVAELPGPRVQQVATYRCSIDLATGQAEVHAGRRSGKEEEAAWKVLSPRLKGDPASYEILIENSEKNAQGHVDWALVSVLETETGSGRLIRKIPVYEFWGAHDHGAARGMMVRDGRLLFFVQFWPE